jgi:chromosome segregation ATPase
MLNLGEWLENHLRNIAAQDVTNLFLLLLLVCFALAVLASLLRRWHAFVHYAPNLLTTLGILGTFIGIVIGLLDFKVGNNAEIQASIGPLLEGLKTAFITSLAGMALAIIFKVLESIGLLNLSHKEQVPGGVGPEEIHAELRQQREAMEKLTQAIVGEEDATLISQVRLLRSDQRDAAKELKGLLEAQIEHQELLTKAAKLQIKRFEEFTGQLWSKLDEFAEMLSKSATEQVITALREVISDFNRNLTEQFGENFKELNAAVGKLVEWQENYRQQLENMREQYAQGVQAITTTEASVTKISEESQQIPVAMGELKTVLTTTQHQLDELQRHLEAFRDMRDRAVEAVPQIRDQMDMMVKDVSTAVKDAGEQIMTASQAVNNAIVEGAKEFENRVNRTNEGLTSASDQLANNSEKIREQLEDTVSDINAKVREMIATVTENTGKLGDTLTESNSKLATDIKEVQFQVTDSIESMQKRLEGSLEEVFQEQTKAMGRSFNAMDDEVRKLVGTTGEAVNKQLEAMDAAMQQELERVIRALGQNLAAVTRRFTEDYSALTDQMARVVGRSRSFENERV